MNLPDLVSHLPGPPGTRSTYSLCQLAGRPPRACLWSWNSVKQTGFSGRRRPPLGRLSTRHTGARAHRTCRPHRAHTRTDRCTQARLAEGCTPGRAAGRQAGGAGAPGAAGDAGASTQPPKAPAFCALRHLPKLTRTLFQQINIIQQVFTDCLVSFVL